MKTVAKARRLRWIGAVMALLVACGEAGSDATEPDAPSGAPDTDVYLAPLSQVEGSLAVGAVTNITDRPGYDNQPAFTPDGAAVLYTAADGSGQADIMRYDIASGRGALLTETWPESEYSATPLPGGGGFSVIRVEADSTQRLWRFDWTGRNPVPLVPGVAPAGYHAWSGSGTVVLFVLGSPPTLQVVDMVSQAARTVAEDVGRSLQADPAGGVTYVQVTDAGGDIVHLDPEVGSTRVLAPVLGGSQDHAWTPAGDLLMAQDGQIYRWAADARSWLPLAMEEAFAGSITRLAVSPDGSLIAFVGSM